MNTLRYINKYHLILGFLFVLLFIQISDVQAQTVINKLSDYVLIDIGESSGYKVGDRVKICRKTSSTEETVIGEVEIVEFREGNCVAKIIMQDSQLKIDTGDYIQQKPASVINQLFDSANRIEKEQPAAKTEQPKPRTVPSPTYKKSNTLSYVLIGTGVAASGLGFYFHSKANSTYDDYENADTAEEAENLFDDTKSLDSSAQISLGVGCGLIAFGVVKMILNHPKPIQTTGRFEIEPVQKKHYSGVQVCFYLN